MLFWKVFAVVDVLINVAWWRALILRQDRVTRFDAVAIPLGLFGTAGVISYAFALPSLPAAVWLYFLPVFLAGTAWEISMASDSDDMIARLPGIAAGILFVGLSSVAISRLAAPAWIG